MSRVRLRRDDGRRNPRDVRECVRERFDENSERGFWEMFALNAGNFFAELRTPEEREAFRQEFPEEYWGIWGFTSPPFGREDFLNFIKRHRPKISFEAPDLRTLLHGAQSAYGACHAIRAEWWLRAGLPLGKAEKEWLDEHQATVPDGSWGCRGRSSHAWLEGSRGSSSPGSSSQRRGRR
jgi:hypothetical protein